MIVVYTSLAVIIFTLGWFVYENYPTLRYYMMMYRTEFKRYCKNQTKLLILLESTNSKIESILLKMDTNHDIVGLFSFLSFYFYKARIVLIFVSRILKIIINILKKGQAIK